MLSKIRIPSQIIVKRLAKGGNQAAIDINAVLAAATSSKSFDSVVIDMA